MTERPIAPWGGWSPRRFGCWVVVVAALVAGAVGLVSVVRMPRGPRTAGELSRLCDDARVALALLENQSLDEAVPRLERLASALPADPFAARNLAVAAIVALGASPADPAVAALARRRLARLEEVEGESRASRWLTGSLALLSGDTASAVEQFTAIVAATPGDPAGWYGLWRAGESRDDQPNSLGWEPLERALAAAPANAWLAVVWMRATATRVEVDGEPGIAAGQLAEAIEARRSAIAPFAPTIAAFTRIDPLVLLDEAVAASRRGDLPTVAGRLRAVANLLAPQTEADRRAVDPHPLEFVLESFAPALLEGFGLGRPEGLPAIPVRFAAGEVLPPPATQPRAVAVDDIDLDGRLDLVSLNDAGLQIFSRDDEGWKPLSELAVPGTSAGLVVADLDLDFDEPRRPARSVLPEADPTEPGAAAPAGVSLRRVCPAADLDLIVFGSRGLACVENLAAAGGTRQLRLFTPPAAGADAEGVTTAALADLDADGRLDLVSGSGSALRVLTSLGSGGFAAGSNQGGLLDCGGSLGAILGIVPLDLDRDVDVDLVVLAADGCGWFENLRHGQFRFVPLPAPPPGSAVIEVLDADADGGWDVVVGGAAGLFRIATRRTPGGTLSAEPPVLIDPGPVQALLALDYDNDATLDLATGGPAGLRFWRGRPDGSFVAAAVPVELPHPAAEGSAAILGLDAGDLDGDGDLDLAICTPAGVATAINIGGHAHHWLEVELEAQQVKGAGFTPSGRVNAHGLGSLLELRAGGGYQPRAVRRRSTHFGLGARPAAEVLRVLWLNGVPQNIIDPPLDTVVCEQQVLLGSCPYLYAWDGREHRFVTDLLWAAPLGLQRRAGELLPARSWEHLLVGGESLAPVEGVYRLQVTEELWEAAYFDTLRLTAVDRPEGVRLVSNEKVGPAEIAAPGIHTVRRPRLPRAAHDQEGRDLRAALAAADGVYQPIGTRGVRQGLTSSSWIELDPGPLPDPAARVLLVLTGWTYPTTVGLNLALDRDPALGSPRPPSLAVPDGDGGWRTVLPFMGFPGGKPKSIAIDLTGRLVPDDPRLRIETSMDIRWDEACFAIDEEPADLMTHPLPLLSADLHPRGFSRVIRDGSDGPERFRYDEVSREPKWPPMLGRFTRFGDVRSLVGAEDDRLVVMAAGDELTLRFDTGPPCPPGRYREFILSSVGWDKDANLATAEGQSVEPLPFRTMRSYPPAPDDSPPVPAGVRSSSLDERTRVQGDSFWRAVRQRGGDGTPRR